MSYRYIVTSCTYQGKDTVRTGYGISLIEDCGDTVTVLDTVADLSPDAESVEQLVRHCNELELDPIHLHEVAYDFAGEL